MNLRLSLAALSFLPATALGRSEPPPGSTTVHDAEGIRQAIAAAKPGARILIAPGEYPGGFYFANLKGAPGKAILIAGADPKNPPRFVGGAAAFHLASAAYVELRDLRVERATDNGINVDDAGRFETPA